MRLCLLFMYFAPGLAYSSVWRVHMTCRCFVCLTSVNLKSKSLSSKEYTDGRAFTMQTAAIEHNAVTTASSLKHFRLLPSGSIHAAHLLSYNKTISNVCNEACEYISAEGYTDLAAFTLLLRNRTFKHLLVHLLNACTHLCTHHQNTSSECRVVFDGLGRVRVARCGSSFNALRSWGSRWTLPVVGTRGENSS